MSLADEVSDQLVEGERIVCLSNRYEWWPFALLAMWVLAAVVLGAYFGYQFAVLLELSTTTFLIVATILTVWFVFAAVMNSLGIIGTECVLTTERFFGRNTMMGKLDIPLDKISDISLDKGSLIDRWMLAGTIVVAGKDRSLAAPLSVPRKYHCIRNAEEFCTKFNQLRKRVNGSSRETPSLQGDDTSH